MTVVALLVAAATMAQPVDAIDATRSELLARLAASQAAFERRADAIEMDIASLLERLSRRPAHSGEPVWMQHR